MFKKIKDIKKKIKAAKIGAVIFGIVFIALIINSICLTLKVHKLEKKFYKNYGTEHTCTDKNQVEQKKYKNKTSQ